MHLQTACRLGSLLGSMVHSLAGTSETSVSSLIDDEPSANRRGNVVHWAAQDSAQAAAQAAVNRAASLCSSSESDDDASSGDAAGVRALVRLVGATCSGSMHRSPPSPWHPS